MDAAIDAQRAKPSPSANIGPACGLIGGQIGMEVLHLLTGLATPSTQGVEHIYDLRIHVNPSLYSNSDQVLVQVVMAHEMFHCFQDDQIVVRAGHPNAALPDWIMEGGANWAAEAVAGPTPYGSIGWADYLAHPEYTLWLESYNAIGFYQHMAEEGIYLGSHFDAMITAFLSGSDWLEADAAAYKATTVNQTTTFSTLGHQA